MKTIRLQQGQVWKREGDFLRIVHLERLWVDFKIVANLTKREGEQSRLSKKEFCRLLKAAILLTPEEVNAFKKGPAPAIVTSASHPAPVAQ